jgi:flagellar biosynthetic protein FliR
MLSFDGGEISRWLGEFFWPFLRTLALFSAAPLFSAAAIPMQAKVAIAFVVAIAVAAAVNQPVPVTPSWASVMLAGQQVLIGLAIGFAMQLTLAAMAFAGDLIGVQMGFGFAALFDAQTGFQVPVISDLFGLVGLVLFIALNGHLLLLGVLVKSFTVVPVAPLSGIAPPGWHALVAAAAALFQMGVWLSLPVVAVLLVADLTVGILSRVAPQINILSLGFSVFMWVGVAVTIALVPFFVPAVEHMIAVGLAAASAALRGG